MNILRDIDAACQRARRFLEEDVAMPGMPFGVKRCSAFHDAERWPDMMLAATYNATHALVLSGAYQNLTKQQTDELCGFVQGFQTQSGAFRFRRMREDEIWKGIDLEYTWAYIDQHITNYAVGMLRALGRDARMPLGFMHAQMNPDALEAWLSRRDLGNPWLEGNSVVNLAGCLIHEMEGRDDELLGRLMETLFRWHDRWQDPETGYWGTNHPARPASLLEGMAGAAHNFHLFYYYNRPIPYAEKIVDHCLSFMAGGVRSACLDVDVVDVLANLYKTGYRRAEIEDALAQFAQRLIAFQNEDGGFADEKNGGVRRMDGWVGGYWEPQGLSNCFATWFRTATLAMIACVLEPASIPRWHFRNTIGIGYYNPHYLEGGERL